MNKKKYVDLDRTINLFNVSLFRNPKTYIIGIVLPVFISLLLEFLWARYSTLEITPPEMISFMYIPVIIGAFYIALFDADSKVNGFFKKVSLKSSNKDIIKYSVVILTIELISINLFLTTILFFIIAQFNTLGFSKELFNNVTAGIWVYYVFFGVLLGVMSEMLFLLFGSIFNKKVYSALTMSCVLVFILIFSDTIIPTKEISNINAMTIIGYFNPIKYVTWSMNLLSSYQFSDPLGSTQIYIQTGNSFEPFNALWQTTVPLILILIGLGFGYAYEKEKF